MKTATLALLAALAAAPSFAGKSDPVAGAGAVVEPGKPAPDFTLPDQTGKERTLSKHFDKTGKKGKFVVLEWYNNGCPFVKKHYESKNMQALQKKYAKKGVVWYSIVSSMEGKQGHLDVMAARGEPEKAGMGSTALLIDEKGDVGRLYGAKTTPHMYVIDPKGTLVYMGAIDDKASADAEDIPKSRNHVSAALDEAMSGKPVSVASTKPYGCSVKY